MESKNPLRHILAIMVTMIPLAYLAAVWNTVPETVALHFDVTGQPDDFGNKNWMLALAIVIALTTLGSYYLIYNSHKFDKKLRGQERPARFGVIATAMVLFLTLINLAVIINGIYPHVNMLDKVLIPGIGLFFVFLGNVFYSLKPNKFVGIRVPWTLSNDENWRQTHKLGSKLFFVGGLLITLVSLGFETRIATMFMTGVALVITATSVLYSYLYYRNSQKNHA